MTLYDNAPPGSSYLCTATVQEMLLKILSLTKSENYTVVLFVHSFVYHFVCRSFVSRKLKSCGHIVIKFSV